MKRHSKKGWSILSQSRRNAVSLETTFCAVTTVSKTNSFNFAVVLLCSIPAFVPCFVVLFRKCLCEHMWMEKWFPSTFANSSKTILFYLSPMYLLTRGPHTTEVAFALLTQLPWVQIPCPLKHILVFRNLSGFANAVSGEGLK